MDAYYQLASGAIGEKQIAQCFGQPGMDPNMMFLAPYKGLFDEEMHTDHMPPTAPDTKHSVVLDQEYEKFEIEAAPCCKPVQGDMVVGIAKDGKIMLHRTNCKIAMDEMASHENRIVRARWRPGENVALLTGITITAIDRKGLLQELTRLISEEMDLNMRAITLEASEGVGRGIIMLYVNNLAGLNRLIRKIRAIEGVEDVRRI